MRRRQMLRHCIQHVQRCGEPQAERDTKPDDEHDRAFAERTWPWYYSEDDDEANWELLNLPDLPDYQIGDDDDGE